MRRTSFDFITALLGEAYLTRSGTTAPPLHGVHPAQCLYVLTEDNPPVSDEIRANFSHVSCLLEIAKERAGVQDVKGGNAAAEERAVALGVLACGAFT